MRPGPRPPGDAGRRIWPSWQSCPGREPPFWHSSSQRSLFSSATEPQLRGFSLCRLWFSVPPFPCGRTPDGFLLAVPPHCASAGLVREPGGAGAAGTAERPFVSRPADDQQVLRWAVACRPAARRHARLPCRVRGPGGTPPAFTDLDRTPSPPCRRPTRGTRSSRHSPLPFVALAPPRLEGLAPHRWSP